MAAPTLTFNILFYIFSTILRTIRKEDAEVKVLYYGNIKCSNVSECIILDTANLQKYVHNNVLHLDVPESYAGRIIGSKGNNIKRLQETLKSHGIYVKRIEIHPKDDILFEAEPVIYSPISYDPIQVKNDAIPARDSLQNMINEAKNDLENDQIQKSSTQDLVR